MDECGCKNIRRCTVADIYVAMVGAGNMTASKGWYCAIVSTTVETANPEQEIQIALQLLGPIAQK